MPGKNGIMRSSIDAKRPLKAPKKGSEYIGEAQRQHSETPARILVVGDEIALCRVIESLLTEAGHQVQSCLSGQEAMAKLKQDSFDLVITDLSMSDVGGLMVLRKAREVDPFCEVIVITGHAPLQSSVEVMNLAAYDCIPNTLSIDEIKDEIKIATDKAIERRRRIRADGVTGLCDDHAFLELLEAEFSRSQRHLRPLSLLLIGLDNLDVDDIVFEHPVGDTVVKEVASLIKRSVRNCDVVATHGRYRLAIILVETSKVDAIDTADRLRRLVEDTDFGHDELFPDRNGSVTASIGVATYPVDACEQRKLLSKAEQALHDAQALGGNLVIAAEQELSPMGNYGEKRLYFLCKRGMDIIVSLLFLLLAFPLFLLIALLIRLDSPGPVVFRQPRVGLRKQVFDGQTVWEIAAFSMYKFRTMYHSRGRGMHWRFMKALIRHDEHEVVRLRGESGSAVNKLSADPRITRVGKVLRRTHLDELPQLFNVLKGEMSLVGPRPPIVYEVAEYEPDHWRRLQTIPGCTGLWQVSGWCAVGFEEQVELDAHYVEHQSLWLDTKILLKTLPAMLLAKGGR